MREQTGAQDTQRSSENAGPTDGHVTGSLQMCHRGAFRSRVTSRDCVHAHVGLHPGFGSFIGAYFTHVGLHKMCRQQVVMKLFIDLSHGPAGLHIFCCRGTFLLNRLLTIPTYLGLDYWISPRNHEVTDGKST